MVHYKTLTLPLKLMSMADIIYFANELIADRTNTLPLLTGNDTFVFEIAHTDFNPMKH